MKGRVFMLATCGGLFLAQPVWSFEVNSQILATLSAQGYTDIDVSRTWLGRTRIVARGPSGTREIVISPNNGEVMRDHLDTNDHSPDHDSDVDGRGAGGGSNGGGSDGGGSDGGGSDGGGGDGGHD